MFPNRRRRVLTRNLLLVSLSVSFLILCTPTYAQSSVPSLPVSLEIFAGQSKVFDIPGLRTVAVGDDTIADVVVVGPEELLVNGKNPGTTTLLVWAENGRSSRTIVVLPHRRPNPDILQQILPPNVSYTWVGTTLLLTGQVHSRQERERIETTVMQLWPETVSAMTLVGDMQSEQVTRKEQALVGILENLYPTVELHKADGLLIIQGEVPNFNDIERLENVAKQLGLVSLMRVTVADTYWQEVITLPVKLGLSKAWVQKVGELFLLRGSVADEAEAQALEAVVSQYGKTVNLLQITKEDQPDLGAEAAEASDTVDEDELRQIRELVANPSIEIMAVNGKVILTGTVSSEEEAVIAEKLARVFTNQVVNCLRVEHGESSQLSVAESIDGEEEYGLSEAARGHSLQTILDQEQTGPTDHTQVRGLLIHGNESLVNQEVISQDNRAVTWDEAVDERITRYLIDLGVEIQELGNGIVLVSGRIFEENSLTVREILNRVYPGWIDNLVILRQVPGQKEVEFLKARAPKGVQVELVEGQILLSGSCSQQEKQAIELQAAALWPDIISTIVPLEDIRAVQVQVRILEVNEDSLSDLGIDVSTSGFGSGLQVQETEFSTGTGSMRITFSAFDEVELIARLHSLKEKGKVRTLAAPNLVLTSGKQASFLAGGEIPLPTMSEEEVSIEWREYGVKLNVSAEILADRIRVDVEPEVSLLDWSNQITIGDVSIPAIRTRKANTSVYLKDGESIVIGGLLGEEERKTVAKVPLLGDLPVIGALFRSERYQTYRSDLVIVLTPRVGVSENPVLLEGVK